MDKCLLKNRFYDKRSDRCIPLDIGGEQILACMMIDMIDHTEIDKLQEYVDKLFINVDDNRRKKFAVLNNKEAVKIICKRLGNILKSYKLGDIRYDFEDYCDRIEIIRWVKDRFVSNISFRDLTGSSYETTPEFMYITIVIGIDPPASVSKLCFKDRDDDSATELKICSRISLMYCESNLELRESISSMDHTQIYLHIKYRAKVSELQS